MRYVIDTSVLVDHLRGGDRLNKFVKSVNKDSELYMSTIVSFEFFLGSSSSKREVADKIEKFRLYIKPIDLTWGIAKMAADIYKETNKNIEAADCFIAATAIEIRAQIVTFNKKHFQKIPGLLIFEPVLQ